MNLQIKILIPSIFRRTVVMMPVLLLMLRVQAQLPQVYPPSVKVNFIRTWIPAAPESDENSLVLRPLKDVKQTTEYLDGIGRPVQTVVKQGSLQTGNNPTDMVDPFLYDNVGRPAEKYMAFASPAADGSFKYNPYVQQDDFYKNQYSVYAGQNESFFLSKTSYEPSPLNRIEKQMAPGINWVGAGRGVTSRYLLNTATDDVKNWIVTDVQNNWSNYKISSSTPSYPAGELRKNILTDEHGKQTITFSDKDEKIILKKIQLTAAIDNGSGSNHQGWLCTYYIYDDLGRLRAVLQPVAIDKIAVAGWLISQDILNELCFRYEYDTRGRMIRKKIPGAGEVWMIYDAKDRLVLSQDANMRTTSNGSPVKWVYFKYDELNRQIESGLWINNNNLSFHVEQAFNSDSYPNMSAQSQEVLTNIFYDDYSWFNNYPAIPVTRTLDAFANNYLYPTSNSWPYAQSPVASDNIKGMISGMRKKIIGTGTYLYFVNFYDARLRPVQMQTSNPDGSLDITSIQYNWAGQQLVTVTKSQKNGNNPQTHITVAKKTYDDLGRLSNVKTQVISKINNQSITGNETETARLEYDKTGQIKRKTIAPAYNNGDGLETETFEYNIRGWTIGVNRNFIKNNNNRNYFAYELAYDKAGNIIPGSSYQNTQYNGNIAGTTWKSRGDGEVRKFDYNYDAAARITASVFTQYNNNNFNNNAGFSFTVGNISYDANGNILTMDQQGWKPGGSVFIDRLTYNYENNNTSNKLKQVIDNSNDNNSILGDFKYDPSSKSPVDYEYDVNGNMVKDNNKKISSITYNYLNLPEKISVTGKGYITYLYDATGNKLKKIVTDNSVNPPLVTTTDYRSNGIYINDTLQFLNITADVRIRIKKSPTPGFAYDYFLKDHLGSVRMVLTDEQKTDQYPPLTFEDQNNDAQNLLWEDKNGQSIAIERNRTERPLAPAFGSADINGKFVKLIANRAAGPIGAGKLLKVMSGDRIHTAIDYYYKKQTGNNDGANTLNSLVNSMINILSGSSVVSNTIKSNAGTVSNAIATDPAAINFFNNINQPPSNRTPKAYLHVLFFDEQFKLDVTASYIEQIKEIPNKSNTINLSAGNAKEALKNGYAYIYFSNESNYAIYFDNFLLTHQHSAILEETHYYPFGLTMSGISSKAAGTLQNKYGITGKEMQNKEFSDGGGLEEYDFGARFYDPQIGRWHNVDPHVANYYCLTPYNYCNNNPLKYLDPSGMDPETSTPEKPKDLQEVVITPKPKPNNSLANRAFGWANFDKKESDQWRSERSVYEDARNKGWTKDQMYAAWSKAGISDKKLKSYETGWQAEQDYRNSQLIVVGIFAAPIVATTAPSIFTGTLTARLASSGSEAASQYLMNVPQYGLGANNFKNINVSSIAGNFLMPGSVVGSAVFGNTFKYSAAEGYAGVSSNASGVYIMTNIGLDYLGNRVGEVHGGFLGDMIGNGSQTVFDNYYNLNK